MPCNKNGKRNKTPVTTSIVLFIVRMCSSYLSSSGSSSRAANMNARIHHATQLLVIGCKPRDITSKKTSSGRNYSSKGHRAAIRGHWPSQIFVAKGHTILEVTERLFGGRWQSKIAHCYIRMRLLRLWRAS